MNFVGKLVIARKLVFEMRSLGIGITNRAKNHSEDLSLKNQLSSCTRHSDTQKSNKSRDIFQEQYSTSVQQLSIRTTSYYKQHLKSATKNFY